MKTDNIKFKSFEEIKDKYIGKVGTPERDQYEFDLKLDILGEIIRKTRKNRNLTQEQLGNLVGVKKSEISKLERNARNMTIGTVLKIFKALKANVKLVVEMEDKEFNIA
jgi:DNA-binding XRE family transcriptional regulator